MQAVIDKVGKFFGLEIRRFPNRLQRNRLALLKRNGVEIVLDVGANKGQYGKEMRAIGYKGVIHSFEPVTKAFNILEASASSDPKWFIHKLGLGAEQQEFEINIASNLASSSMLVMGEAHRTAAPDIGFIGTETINVHRLDNLVNELGISDRGPFYLKIDTQGFEQQVLKGCGKLLESSIIGVQIELSLVELYEGEMLYRDMISYLASYGFKLQSIEPGFINAQTGQMLQFDGIFYKGG